MYYVHMIEMCSSLMQACKRALRKVAPVLGAPDIFELLQRKAFDDSVRLDYDEWLDQLAPLLVANFRDRVNLYLMTAIEYYKSQWTRIRANAALFSGMFVCVYQRIINSVLGRLLQHLPVSERRNINTDQACVGMLSCD